jgi:hypothetical protein
MYGHEHVNTEHDPYLSSEAQQQTIQYINTFYIIPMNDTGLTQHTVM